MDNGILVVALLDPSTLLAFLKAAFGLGVVIFVHELGHFVVAKACGVKCEKFYVGFDAPLKIGPIRLPRTLFRKQWGETEYGIGIIPLGGYVKMLGQDDNPANAAAEAERIRNGGSLDPRSYPSKTVPQRMAIISAGVVFNLIFGLIFAAIAYKMGVSYTPTLIGGTSVGDPAWMAGIQPGDKIVSLNEDEADDDQLRFREDLQVKMFSLAKGEEVSLHLKDRQGDLRWVTLQPNSGYQKRTGTPTIGVWMAQDPTVFGVVEDSIAQQAGLKPGDKITSIRGNGQEYEIRDGVDFQHAMARLPQSPITLTVDRQDEESQSSSTHEITLGVESAKRFGIELTMGPLVCVQQGSVAAQAGLKVGDVLTELDGQPIGDPLTLPTRFAEFIEQEITLTVMREGSAQTIRLTPAAPNMISSVRRRNGPIGLDPLGVGYVMGPTVEGVIPGSPAERAGIQPGDTLKSVQLLLPTAPIPEEEMWTFLPEVQIFFANRRNRDMLAAFELDKPLLIGDDHNNWPFLVTSVQSQDFQIDLTYERGSQESTVRMTPERSDTMIAPDRGFATKGHEDILKATSWGQALSLGRREVWEGMRQVVIVLSKLASNYKNLGGPITIARVATMEASEGLPRLLMFLTLLSANLAVLNFLPIPVLDGGHMLFLAYEGIVGKPVNERIQFSLTVVGFSLLMGLMVFVFGLDISRL